MGANNGVTSTVTTLSDTHSTSWWSPVSGHFVPEVQVMESIDDPFVLMCLGFRKIFVIVFQYVLKLYKTVKV